MAEVPSVQSAAKAPVITVESHLNIVADLQADIAKLEANLVKVYTKDQVLITSVAAFVAGLALGFLI